MVPGLYLYSRLVGQSEFEVYWKMQGNSHPRTNQDRATARMHFDRRGNS